MKNLILTALVLLAPLTFAEETVKSAAKDVKAGVKTGAVEVKTVTKKGARSMKKEARRIFGTDTKAKEAQYDGNNAKDEAARKAKLQQIEAERKH